MIIKRTTTFLALGSVLAACALGSAPHRRARAWQKNASETKNAPGIVWDVSTRVCIERGATYGRIVRLANDDLLCAYEKAGRAWVARSRNNGKSWEQKQIARELAFANAANPELLVLRGGRVLLFYNQRPNDKIHPFAIGACLSDNHGATWQPLPNNLFVAGTEPGQGCWEPAALQMPNGEIQLFFANEFPYPKNDDQEITRLRSINEGRTWSGPETVSLRVGHRDGMPIPILLQNQSDITVAIEDNGLKPGNQLQPALLLVARKMGTPLIGAGDTARRREAVDPPLGERVYAGAPYIKQLPSGETVLSCQSSEGGRAQPQMVVYVGDRSARHLARKSIPFPTPENISGNWNALFVKNAHTITAISDTTVGGVRGLWAIDGHLVK